MDTALRRVASRRFALNVRTYARTLCVSHPNVARFVRKLKPRIFSFPCAAKGVSLKIRSSDRVSSKIISRDDFIVIDKHFAIITLDVFRQD